MSFEKELKRRNRLIELDRAYRNMGGSKGIPKWFLGVTCLMLIGAVGAGYWIGFSDSLSEKRFSASKDYRYSIDGYNISFVTCEENKDMCGNAGFTYNKWDDDIFLNKNMLIENRWQSIRTTCVHEKLHNLGISESNHDMIYHYEWQIKDDPTCNKLVDRLLRG
jgi:hypothetical protein